MVSKSDKNTVDQSCKNYSPKRKYFEFKNHSHALLSYVLRQLIDPIIHRKFSHKILKDFFVKSGIQFPKSSCHATSRVKHTEAEINPTEVKFFRSKLKWINHCEVSQQRIFFFERRKQIWSLRELLCCIHPSRSLRETLKVV